MTIAENLKNYIDAIEDEINRNNFCTLIFKIKDGQVIRMEKELSINLDEIKIGITK
ncbi:MAG: hypothetical protein ACYDIA_01840 [Candidatus Humimicrobiaceae bacterium]